jgi:hypothetical protein
VQPVLLHQAAPSSTKQEPLKLRLHRGCTHLYPPVPTCVPPTCNQPASPTRRQPAAIITPHSFRAAVKHGPSEANNHFNLAVALTDDGNPLKDSEEVRVVQMPLSGFVFHIVIVAVLCVVFF